MALRPVEASDLPIFFEHQRDSVAVRLAAFPSRDREAFDAHWAKVLKSPTGLVRTVLFEGEVAGYVLSFELDGRREVGYWIGRNLWGRGVATRALALFLEVETARPLYGHVAKSNVGSIRVLEKCGFGAGAEENDDAIVLKLGGEP